MERIDQNKLTLGVAKLGLNILNEAEESFRKLDDYIESLKTDQEQLIAVYLCFVRYLSCFDEKEREDILEKINETKWERI